MKIEKIIEGIQGRIEDNSVKSTMRYIDREGIEHEELVYLKHGKSKGDNWHQVYPVIKDLTDEEVEAIGNKWWKKVMWTNLIFGGKKNLIKLIFYLVLFSLAILTIREAYSNYESLVNLPCVQSCLNSFNG